MIDWLIYVIERSILKNRLNLLNFIIISNYTWWYAGVNVATCCIYTYHSIGKQQQHYTLVPSVLLAFHMTFKDTPYFEKEILVSLGYPHIAVRDNPCNEESLRIDNKYSFPLISWKLIMDWSLHDIFFHLFISLNWSVFSGINAVLQMLIKCD